MKKILALAAMVTLFATLATAQTINFSDKEASVDQGATIALSGDVDPGQHDRVYVDTASATPLDISFSDTVLRNEGEVTIFATAGEDVDLATYSFTTDFTFENTTVNNGSVDYEETTQQRIFNVTVETPLETVYQGSVSEDDVLSIGSTINLTVDSVNTNSIDVEMTDKDDKSIGLDESTTVTYGDTTIKVKAFASFDGPSLKILSNERFDVEKVTKQTQETQECTLGFRTVLSVQRGSNLVGRTICQETGERVGNVEVTITDEGRSKLITENPQSSDTTGFFRVRVPEETKGPMTLRLTPAADMEDKYRSNTKQLVFGQTYDSYIQNKPRFQLQVANLPEKAMTGDNLTGVIKNKVGENITGATLEVEKPDGTRDIIDVDDDAGFKIGNTTNGTYSFTASMKDFGNSDTVDVTVKRPSEEIEIEVVEQNPNNPVVPGEEIKLRFVNEDGEQISRTLNDVKIKVGETVSTYTVSGGEFPSGSESLDTEWWPLVDSETCSGGLESCEPLSASADIQVSIPRQSTYASSNDEVYVSEREGFLAGAGAVTSGKTPIVLMMVVGILLGGGILYKRRGGSLSSGNSGGGNVKYGPSTASGNGENSEIKIDNIEEEVDE